MDTCMESPDLVSPLFYYVKMKKTEVMTNSHNMKRQCIARYMIVKDTTIELLSYLMCKSWKSFLTVTTQIISNYALKKGAEKSASVNGPMIFLMYYA